MKKLTILCTAIIFSAGAYAQQQDKVTTQKSMQAVAFPKGMKLQSAKQSDVVVVDNNVKKRAGVYKRNTTEKVYKTPVDNRVEFRKYKTYNSAVKS